MSTFTLVISCLTTSYLPWFMDLTLQVPMQYYSLQHCSLRPSPVASIAGYCFCFGSIPSFFLELFLHWSPVAYWVPNDLGSSSFSILSFCLFSWLGRTVQKWGREALHPAQGQGWRPRQDAPLPRSGVSAKRSNPTSKEQRLRRRRKAERSYSTFKVRRGGHEEIPLIQGKEQRLHFAGAAVKRYPTSKVKKKQLRW